MDDNLIQSAIITLLTVGVLLLNVGADLVKAGSVELGIALCAIGALFIVTAVVLIKLLAEQVAKRVALG